MNHKISWATAVSLTAWLVISMACMQPAPNTNVGHATPPTASPSAVQSTVADGDWPGYNRTLDSQRYSPLNQITTENVGSMKQVCSFDLGETGNFQSGIIVVNNLMYVTTETNTFAVDPGTCQQK